VELSIIHFLSSATREATTTGSGGNFWKIGLPYISRYSAERKKVSKDTKSEGEKQEGEEKRERRRSGEERESKKKEKLKDE
jgi:hypothetical protein